MSKQPATSFLKRFVAFIHILFACVTLIGIGFMYLNSNYGRGLDWIENETYEQSPEFNKKVQSDISNIFDYIQYQEIFETGGKQFCYRTRNPELQVGDYVYVPVGYNREERAARIVKMKNYVGRFAPYPLEKTKYIKRKISKEEWVTKGIKIQI